MSDISLSDYNEMEPPTKKMKVEDEQNCDVADDEKEDDEVSPNADINEDVKPSSVQVTEDKCMDYVTPEELERLHQFQVLDEVHSDDGDSDRNDNEDSSDDDKSDGVPAEEIERMLEENLPEELRGAPKPKERPYVTRQKIVLEEKGVNHFEVLPLDWMMVRHYSGMPVYMHRSTRVCTLAKPYFLGKGNTRRHDIPISAIPCLAYRRALEEEEKQKEIDKDIEEQIKNCTFTQKTDTQKPKDKNRGKDKTNSNTAGNEVYGNDNLDIHMTDVDNSESSKKSAEKIDNDLSASIKGLQKRRPSKCPFKHKIVNGSVEIKPKRKGDDDGSNTTEAKEKKNEVSSNEDSDAANETVSDSDSESKVNEIATECRHKASGNDNENTIESKQNVDDHAIKVVKIENFDENTINLKQSCDGNENSIDSQPNVRDGNENSTVEGNENGGKDSPKPIQENGVDKPDEDVQNIHKETEGAKTDDIPLNRKPVVLPGGVVMPPPRVETAGSSWKCQLLTPDQVHQYCRSLFRFNTLNIMHFRRWADRRKYTKARKTLQYPTLPEGTKLITIPAAKDGQDNTTGGGRSRRDWVMNMNGRSYLSVFHEYVRRALQKQPVYEFKQLENASAPYQATVHIGGMAYGVGTGTSKRQAKANAATASIHILIPEMRDQIVNPDHEPDFSFFDCIGIEDPRITEFCVATCEPSPHAILRTCLLRNFGAGDRHIHTEMKKLEYQKIELTMRVGRHSATVVCKNKKSAKQRASQAILQLLHPHVRSWGSLLRLYGSRSLKSCKERKLEEQQITLLQDSARQNEPNYAVLEKLRCEMRALRDRDQAVVPIGTLILTDELPTHSGSNLNNVQL